MISKSDIEAVAGLRERYGSSYNLADRELIKTLYSTLLGKELRAGKCQNCYHDAVIELYLYVKRNSTMKEKAELKAGAVISCPTFKKGTIYTNKNLTDKVAREYLEMFPNRSFLFSVLPSKDEKKKAVRAKKTAKNEDK